MLNRKSIVLPLAVLLTACGPKFHADDYDNPRELAAAAVARAATDGCGGVETPLRAALFEIPPRDPQVADIRLALAECEFESGAFLEASRQFRRIADDFPDHPQAAEALLRSGDALSRLWRRPELDPTYGQSAMATYVEVLGRFPTGAVADSARQRIAELNEDFAEKDFKNAEYYYRIRAFDSAIIYYRHVVENYPQSSFSPRAMLRLVEVFGRLGYEDERRDSCTYLHRFHPDVEGVAAACPEG
jgi:outer membrane protein assembly factor BamD